MRTFAIMTKRSLMKTYGGEEGLKKAQEDAQNYDTKMIVVQLLAEFDNGEGTSDGASATFFATEDRE